jgi:hypothetical protein
MAGFSNRIISRGLLQGCHRAVHFGSVRLAEKFSFQDFSLTAQRLAAMEDRTARCWAEDLPGYASGPCLRIVPHETRSKAANETPAPVPTLSPVLAAVDKAIFRGHGSQPP